MFLGDPRESLVDFNAPGTWEADNRVEERWQWGAQVLDLCNLSPEEYKNSTAVTVKTIQNCGECSGGGGGAVENDGNATLGKDGQFKVSFDSPVASQLYLFVTFKDGEDEEYTFATSVEKGTKEASFDVKQISSVSPYTITDIKIGLKEDGSDASDTVKDGKYEYIVIYEGSVAGKTYVLSILCTKTQELTGEDYLNIIKAQGAGFDYVASYDEFDFGNDEVAEAVFYAPCSYVESWMNESAETQYFAENSYDFVILTQETITDIKEDFTTDTNNWGQDIITINNSEFNKWVRRDLSGAQCPYSVNDGTCEDYELSFVIKIKK